MEYKWPMKKLLTPGIFSLADLSGIPQHALVQHSTPTTALQLSKTLAEKASWFTSLLQYLKNSTLFYTEKALHVLYR